MMTDQSPDKRSSNSRSILL